MEKSRQGGILRCVGGPTVEVRGVVGATGRRAKTASWLASAALREILPQVRSPGSNRTYPSAYPELDCVRHLLPDRILAAAERRAEAIGVGAERVLVCADAMTEEAYLTALATYLGTAYERFDTVSRGDCPLDDDRLIEAAAAGLLPLRQGRDLVWIIAPRGATARRLADPREPQPRWLRSFRLTSADRLRHFVMRHGQRALGRRASEVLRDNQPQFSAAPRQSGRRGAAAIAIAMLILVFFVAAPIPVIEGLSALCCVLFLAAALLRLLSACFSSAASRHCAPIDDAALPIYTVICALYREAAVVEHLVAAIKALDYPPEKLDIKFVLEADDPATHDALRRLHLGPPFEIITAPPVGPRTKPKALNVALPFARGAFTVVYDAEDIPAPDQLRRALEAFRAGGSRLVCVQAGLAIDNAADNCLTRIFVANYAGQFDVFLRGLGALHLPFPLGGSSNHFRTAALRKAGAWDPYNVTEDADLGIRLCRLGYGTGTIASTTYEEAPARLVPWLRQRTRWHKGWMQTWLVHMRRPIGLVRDLGPAGALSIQIVFAANVLAALIHPLFMAGLGYTLYALPEPWANAVMKNAAPIFIMSLASSYASTVVLDLIGLHRRGLLRHAWTLVLTPLHWVLLSLAAWRALFQLIYDPQRWEKTEHGFARTSLAAVSRGPGRRGSDHSMNGPKHVSTIRDQSPTRPVAQFSPHAPIAPIRMRRPRGVVEITRQSHQAMREPGYFRDSYISAR